MALRMGKTRSVALGDRGCCGAAGSVALVVRSDDGVPGSSSIGDTVLYTPGALGWAAGSASSFRCGSSSAMVAARLHAGEVVGYGYSCGPPRV